MGASKDAVVRLDGEIDLATTPATRKLVDDALASGAERVVVDVDGVRFIDSTGLKMLLQAFDDAAALRVDLGVVGVGDQFQHVLKITGLLSVPPFNTA